MNRDKYVTSEEKKVIDNSIKLQISELKKELSDNSNFKIKEEIKNVTVMMEEGDMNGDE